MLGDAAFSVEGRHRPHQLLLLVAHGDDSALDEEGAHRVFDVAARTVVLPALGVKVDLTGEHIRDGRAVAECVFENLAQQ